MKLKARIIVGFTMIILVPLLLFAAALYGFRETQSKQTVTQTETDSDGEVYDIAISQSDDQGSVFVCIYYSYIYSSGNWSLAVPEYCHSLGKT